MADDGKPKSNSVNYKGKKRKYLPHGKPVKKGLYPLRPGVQGFFLTCDGGRERQASNEALNLLETFYEELVHGKISDCLDAETPAVASKPLNKKIKFSDSDSDSSSDEEDGTHVDEVDAALQYHGDQQTETVKEGVSVRDGEEKENGKFANGSEDLPSKKQRVETNLSALENVECPKVEDKPIDEQIEDELKELGDRNKRHFVSLDSGCNGVVFIQMHKRARDPGPIEIVQHLMSRVASTRKHMSRFILRILPVELTCYASEEEISKEIKPFIEKYFAAEAPAQKFAVLYDARANTGIERMSIINAVAKSVPHPHTVDLKNPDKSIVVQIVKTICLIGAVEKYKEFSKYNLRELTSPKH